MTASPFSVVMLFCGSLPWLRSPACLMEVAPLLLGEKPQTRPVNPINLLQLNLTRNQLIHLCPIVLSAFSKDVKNQGSFLFPLHAHTNTQLKKKKKKVGLQINCCQYKHTEMQFNSVSNGWGLLSVCHCQEYRLENYTDWTNHIDTHNLNLQEQPVVMMLFTVRCAWVLWKNKYFLSGASLQGLFSCGSSLSVFCTVLGVVPDMTKLTLSPW